MTHRFCQLFLEDHLASWGLQRLHFFNPNDGNGSVVAGQFSKDQNSAPDRQQLIPARRIARRSPLLLHGPLLGR